MQMRSTCRFLAILVLASSPLAAQAPHLTGRVEIGLSKGTLSADLCLRNLPSANLIRVLLHHGLNVRAMTDSAGHPLPYEGPLSLQGDALAYTVTVADTGPHPRSLCVSYGGQYPVYSRLDAAADYKGEIAFTGITMRAAEQTKWYPVLADSVTGQIALDESYDLVIHCPECTAVFVNGSAPHPGPDVHLTSDTPRPLLLFAGKFHYRQVAGTWFLNATLADSEARALASTIGRIEQVDARLLGIPFRDSLVLIQHSATNQAHRQGTWGFTTWPSIAFAGTPLARLAQGATGRDSTMSWVRAFLAHELGHYCFGTLMQPRGAYRWFYLESTAEYLSMLVSRELDGPGAYRQSLNLHLQSAERLKTPVRFDRISEASQIGEVYRYRYAPLLLVALERRIGQDRMREVLHTIVSAPASVPRDYRFLEATVLGSGVRAETWHRFEEECVTPGPARSCLMALGQPDPHS